MSRDARRAVLLLDGELFTADVSSQGGWRKVDGIKPPYQIVAVSEDIGTAPLTPSLAIHAQGGVSKGLSEGRAIVSTGTNVVTGPTLNAAGDEADIGTDQPEQITLYVRANYVVTFGTANGGSKVWAWLIGNAD